MQSTLFYNYEKIFRIIKFSKALASSDFCVSMSLYGQLWWEMSRFYYVYIEISSKADKLQAKILIYRVLILRLAGMDTLVFIFYADELTIDVETG